MSYKEFYMQVMAVHKNNPTDPIDFANDIIAIINRFESENAAQPSVQADGAESVCKICSSPAVGKDGYCQACR